MTYYSKLQHLLHSNHLDNMAYQDMRYILDMDDYDEGEHSELQQEKIEDIYDNYS